MAVGDEIRRRRQERGLSQARLAALAHTTQQTVDRIESGVTRHSRAMPQILAVLDLAPGAVQVARTDVVPSALPRPGGDLPIFASAQGGPGEMILTYEPIDYVARPDPLANVRDGYAMYIVGDSMSPAFEQGDLALVNPHLPFRGGDDVLVFRELAGEVAAMVKRLVKASQEEWILEQYNPARRFTLPRKEWPRCHVIIGKYSRR
jgi:phage repressor protein C with HTH and peptisase S24 domain